MKIISFVLLTLFFFPVSFAQKKPLENKKGNSIEKIINSQWTFNYFPGSIADKGFEAPGFDDSKWPAISIPHTWSTYETTRELHPFIRNPSENDNPYWWMGWGWYRKHFSITVNYSGRKVFVEFEGVQKYCKVWLNGKYLGDHKGGYGSFDFDITNVVKPGEDNLLAVAVNNRQKDENKIPPMAAGDFNVYGGICRNVTIVVKNRLFIPMQGSAAHEGGMSVTTPQVSEKEGNVRVQTWVRNDNPEKKTCTLLTSISDVADKVIQVIRSEAVIDPGQLFIFDQTSKPVKNPHLWSNDDPYLYKISSQLMDGKDIADVCSSPLGFRWFRWNDTEKAFYLNDKKMILHGGNHFQEYPWLGDAIPEWITVMDLTDMAENLNYNFLRTGNYSNDDIVFDFADKSGIVIFEESVNNIIDKEFSVEVQEQLKTEMTRRHRNHPSLMLFPSGHGINNGVVCENLLRCTIRGWYNKDVRNLEPIDCEQSGTEEHQQNMLKASKQLGAGNLCTWLYADHGADREYINSPLLHVSPKGFVDINRVPKYAYYLWQASYSKKPIVFIQPHHWRSRYLGQMKDIVVNSDCDKVELFVNGSSKGYKLLDPTNFHSITFNNVLIENGTLSALGTRDGKTVRAEVVMADEPAKIVVTSSHDRIIADRGSVAVIRADVVDSRGNHVVGANNTIKWTLSGPATLVGPSVYESEINKHHLMDGIWYMDMPVSNVIRSTGSAGKIHITVSASGLTSGSFDITADEIVTDNSIIEPVLQDDGRTAVAKVLLNANRPEEVPREIKPALDEFNVGHSDKSGYTTIIRKYIMENNPLIDTSTVEFNTLLNIFASQLLNSDGHLTADDYNFSVDHFNNCRLISGYINGTKLPQPFKDGLRMYYAESIIKQGSEKDAGEEMNWLNWIPSGGTVVIVQNEKTNPPLKGVIFSKEAGLAEIISVVYPQFVKFSPDAKERALVFIDKMNPYVHGYTQSDQNSKVDNITQADVSYTAEKGQPILIPLLKFIAE